VRKSNRFVPQKKQNLGFKKWGKHTFTKIHREVYENYRVRSAVVRVLWNMAKTLKHALIKKG
jgi:hypothetical protein